MGGFISGLNPDTAYISIPTRPPAQNWVMPPAPEALNRAFQIFDEKIDHVEYLIGYEGNAFAFTGDVEKDLLSITSVHPMRARAVKELLLKANKDWDIVEQWRAAVNDAIDREEPRPEEFTIRIEYRDGPQEFKFDSLEVESAIKNLRFQIIDSDYKIIENSDMVVVYHPRKSISAGVMCEMVYAKSLAKLVYAYYPYEPSPFFEWYATRIFTDEKKLREFLIKESKLTGQTPLDIY